MFVKPNRPAACLYMMYVLLWQCKACCLLLLADRVCGQTGSQSVWWCLHVLCHAVLCCAVLQVRYSEMPASVLSAANKLGGGRAQPALQLVGYEGEVEAAIKYAFGNTFVCQVSGMKAPLLQPWGINKATLVRKAGRGSSAC